MDLNGKYGINLNLWFNNFNAVVKLHLQARPSNISWPKCIICFKLLIDDNKGSILYFGSSHLCRLEIFFPWTLYICTYKWLLPIICALFQIWQCWFDQCRYSLEGSINVGTSKVTHHLCSTLQYPLWYCQKSSISTDHDPFQIQFPHVCIRTVKSSDKEHQKRRWGILQVVAHLQVSD